MVASRLLLVGHDGLRHGAQLLLLHLAERLVRRHGAAVDVLLLGPGPLEEAFALIAPTRVMDRSDPQLAAHLRALRRDGMCGAIINSVASGALAPMLRSHGVPCVLLVHEMPGLIREKHLLETTKAALAASTEVVVAAREVAASLGPLADWPDERAIVLPQGLYRTIEFSRERRAALRERLGIGADDVVVAGLGYADTRKGFDIFLQLWRITHERKRRGRGSERAVHFLWAGGMDPHLKHYLSGEIEAATVTGCFHLPGFVDDPSEVLSAADCHALTSREDPYPSVVLEAMAAGLQTVAFEGTGGIPAFLRREDAGKVIARGDLSGFSSALVSDACLSTQAVRARRIGRRPFCFDEYARRLLHLARPALLDISVAVLSYNYEAYMAERMSSVLSQSHPVREVLVLDDASVDASVATAAAVARCCKRQIEIVVSPANSGSPFKQWRDAAERAHGEWLWIAEADDAAEPSFLTVLADRLASAPKAVLGFTDSRVIDADGLPVASSYQDYYRQSRCVELCRDGVHSGPELLRRCLADRNVILNASAVLFRRSALRTALERCGDELDALRVAGDWRIYAEMLSEPDSQVVYVASPLNVHRRHAASVTHRLAARQHLVEVSQVHAAIARLGGIDQHDRARQRAYRTSLRAQFRLRVAR